MVDRKQGSGERESRCAAASQGKRGEDRRERSRRHVLAHPPSVCFAQGGCGTPSPLCSTPLWQPSRSATAMPGAEAAPAGEAWCADASSAVCAAPSQRTQVHQGLARQACSAACARRAWHVGDERRREARAASAPPAPCVWPRSDCCSTCCAQRGPHTAWPPPRAPTQPAVSSRLPPPVTCGPAAAVGGPSGAAHCMAPPG